MENETKFEKNLHSFVSCKLIIKPTERNIRSCVVTIREKSVTTFNSKINKEARILPFFHRRENPLLEFYFKIIDKSNTKKNMR